MWYVMQTMTGQEEELVGLVRILVPSCLYTDCFVAYHERIWRKMQQSVVHVERLFPGYVFIITDNPEELYLELKKVPAMSKLIASGKCDFLPIEKEEETFFSDMLSQDHVVRLSYVETDGKGHVSHIFGPLEKYKRQVERYQFKKRYAIVRLQMLGQEKTVALGIILKEDVRQEVLYGKVETPHAVPALYKVEKNKSETALEQEQALSIGDHVKVIAGPLSDLAGVVWRVKRDSVEIGVHLFGQDMAVEVPKKELRNIP